MNRFNIQGIDSFKVNISKAKIVQRALILDKLFLCLKLALEAVIKRFISLRVSKQKKWLIFAILKYYISKISAFCKQQLLRKSYLSPWMDLPHKFQLIYFIFYDLNAKSSMTQWAQKRPTDVPRGRPLWTRGRPKWTSLGRKK